MLKQFDPFQFQGNVKHKNWHQKLFEEMKEHFGKSWKKEVHKANLLTELKAQKEYKGILTPYTLKLLRAEQKLKYKEYSYSDVLSPTMLPIGIYIWIIQRTIEKNYISEVTQKTLPKIIEDLMSDETEALLRKIVDIFDKCFPEYWEANEFIRYEGLIIQNLPKLDKYKEAWKVFEKGVNATLNTLTEKQVKLNEDKEQLREMLYYHCPKKDRADLQIQVSPEVKDIFKRFCEYNELTFNEGLIHLLILASNKLDT